LRVTILGINYMPEETGIAPYSAAFAEDLAARGHDVTVVTTHPHYPEWAIRDGYGGWRRSELLNGVKVKRLRHYVPKSARGARRLVSEVSFGLRLLTTPWNRPDVVVLVSPALFSSAIAMTRARFAPSKPATGVWVQDIYALGVKETQSSGNVVARVIDAVEKRLFSAAHGVVVIHQRFRNHVLSASRVSSDDVLVVRNWTHLDPPAEVDIVAARKDLGWNGDEVIVLHAGAQGIKQDLSNVVEAARLADERSLNLRFVLMGDGSQRMRLEREAEGIQRISFIPPLPRDEFQKALSSADVLLVNEKGGLNEMAVPSKLTSYFNSGRPVLAATDPGSVTAEEVSASGGGLQVDPSNPEALVDAVQRIAQDPELGKSLADAARVFRVEQLDSDAALDRLEAWLHTLRR